MFFGAGNLIFHLSLGMKQENTVWISISRVYISEGKQVFPIVGVISIAKAGSFQTLGG